MIATVGQSQSPKSPCTCLHENPAHCIHLPWCERIRVLEQERDRLKVAVANLKECVCNFHRRAGMSEQELQARSWDWIWQADTTKQVEPPTEAKGEQ